MVAKEAFMVANRLSCAGRGDVALDIAVKSVRVIIIVSQDIGYSAQADEGKNQT